jgi:hypothetical protein
VQQTWEVVRFSSQTQGRLLHLVCMEGMREKWTPLDLGLTFRIPVSPTRPSCMLTFDDAQCSYMPKGERHLLGQLMNQLMFPRPLIDHLCLRVSDMKASSRRLRAAEVLAANAGLHLSRSKPGGKSCETDSKAVVSSPLPRMRCRRTYQVGR